MKVNAVLKFKLAAVGLLVCIASHSFGQDLGPRVVREEIIRIDPSSDMDSGRVSAESLRVALDENRALRSRVRQLERAVRQLQDYVFYANAGAQATSTVEPRWACSITTHFHGTFIASAPTKLEGTANALRKCEASGEPFCRDDMVKCEKEQR